jgi:hypothetical protein
MSTTLTIGGASVSIPRDLVPGTLVAFTRDGAPSFSFYVRGGKPTAPPDPYLGKEARLTVGGTLVFVGDVVSVHPEHGGENGWQFAYQCLGAAHRMERFPHTDSNTGTVTSVYNANLEDTQNYLPARAGRTVGQIIADVLSFKANGDNLTARGIGNLTYNSGTGTYTLPTATANDCAALSLIPNGPVYFQGEQFWHALAGFIQEYTRNYLLHVEPGGDIRILDVRSFTPHTFTMGADPVLPTELSRDWHGCFPRVLILGAPIAVMALLKLSNGSLIENFAYASFTNAQAKTAWTPGQFHQASAQDSGTCTCGDTLHVTVTSSNSSYSWSSNYWDFTAAGRHGAVNLYSTVVTGVTQVYTARIVSNTALVPVSSGGSGTSILTLDTPLPHTSFDRYTITGLAAQDGSIVWRKYQIANTSLWPRVTVQSTFPQAFFNSGGGVTLTSTPMGGILWPISGSSPPYNQFPMPFTYDNNGNIYFAGPTYTVANNAAPADVWALIPVYSDPNQAVAPADVSGVPQYAGTSYTVEGKTDTFVVPCPAWRDPANLAQMQAYAAEILDAVKDTVVEGAITYLGLYQNALVPGLKANVTGVDFTTGWEAVNLPVVEASLVWQPKGPTSWVTRMTCSSRRSFLSEAFYMRPARSFASPLESDPFMGSQAAYAQAVGSMQYTTPGAFGVQEGGAIPLPMTPAEQKEAFAAQQQAERQTVERQRQLESAPARAEQEAAQRQKAMEAQIMEAMGPAGLPSRAQESPGERAARIAQEVEQRQGLPSGGLVSGAPSADMTAQGQAQRARDAEQAADITAREQARASRAREDVTSSAPRIAAEGQAQHAKELEQGREVGTREQARAARGHERGQELVEQEQQHAADRRAVDERRGEELAEEQRRRREGEES